MIKLKELKALKENLYRSVCKVNRNYGSGYFNIMIPVYKSVITKELPLFIEEK